MIDYSAVRLNMVESQLRTNQVVDERVLDAFLAVPRERFVPPSLRGIAYIDDNLPLGGGRWLMAPLVLARLVQLAEIAPEHAVLDVGGGTGYGAAVLARLARQVVAVESDLQLLAEAAARLKELGAANAQAIEAPLPQGCPTRGPYDAILIEGAAARIPDALAEQLAEGGRLLAVMQEESGMGRAVLMSRTAGVLSRRPVFDAAVPLLPGFDRVPSFQF